MATIEINPAPPKQAAKSVILLHGLGADGNDFVPIVSELGLSDPLALRFVFPDAPFRPITINQGYVMRAWYDIYAIELDARVDLGGINESINLIDALIEKENQLGIPTENIILAGFSQGAVIALSTALRYPKRLGGVLSLSGYLPFSNKLLTNASETNKNIPIFIGHGTEDTIVPYGLGLAMQEVLNKYGYAVEWHSYVMGHSVCGEEVGDIRGWLEKVFWDFD